MKTSRQSTVDRRQSSRHPALARAAAAVTLRRGGTDHYSRCRLSTVDCRLFSFSVLTLVALGCAPVKPKESKLSHDVKIVQTENEPSKLFERGKQFQAVGDLTRAEQYYAAAMQTGYPESKVLPLLLHVCIEGHRLQVAIDYAEPVLKKNPKDHKLRMVLASLYSATGQHSRARAYYEQVVAEDPDDAIAHYALAVTLRDEFHDRVGADRHFREYLRLSPEGPHAEEAKGSLLKDVTAAPTLPTVPAPAPSASAAVTLDKPTPLVAPPAASQKPQKLP